jgi:hypothetical protein
MFSASFSLAASAHGGGGFRSAPFTFRLGGGLEQLHVHIPHLLPRL